MSQVVRHMLFVLSCFSLWASLVSARNKPWLCSGDGCFHRHGYELAKRCAEEGFDLLISADEAAIREVADQIRESSLIDEIGSFFIFSWDSLSEKGQRVWYFVAYPFHVSII